MCVFFGCTHTRACSCSHFWPCRGVCCDVCVCVCVANAPFQSARAYDHKFATGNCGRAGKDQQQPEKGTSMMSKNMAAKQKTNETRTATGAHLQHYFAVKCVCSHVSTRRARLIYDGATLYALARIPELRTIR